MDNRHKSYQRRAAVLVFFVLSLLLALMILKMGYLMICKAQYEDQKYAGNYNVGPNETDCLTTGELVTLFCEKWNEATGDQIKWIDRYDGGPHEANFLKLDCSKLKTVFGWKPHWNLDMAIEKVVEWSKCWMNKGDVRACMDQEINEFLGKDL